MSIRRRRQTIYSYGSRQIAQRRREGIWSRLKRAIHECSPRIDLGDWPRI